jgi:hypothetical protein
MTSIITYRIIRLCCTLKSFLAFTNTSLSLVFGSNANATWSAPTIHGQALTQDYRNWVCDTAGCDRIRTPHTSGFLRLISGTPQQHKSMLINRSCVATHYDACSPVPTQLTCYSNSEMVSGARTVWFMHWRRQASDSTDKPWMVRTSAWYENHNEDYDRRSHSI